MKLSLRANKNHGWVIHNCGTYNLTEKIMKFCQEKNIKKCEFKLIGEANIKCEVSGLPALFG